MQEGGHCPDISIRQRCAVEIQCGRIENLTTYMKSSRSGARQRAAPLLVEAQENSIEENESGKVFAVENDNFNIRQPGCSNERQMALAVDLVVKYSEYIQNDGKKCSEFEKTALVIVPRAVAIPLRPPHPLQPQRIHAGS